MKILNRRAVLRGVGGAAIALPYLDIMRPAREARAQTGAISKVGKNGRPKRFILVATYSGQGLKWFANSAGADGLVLGPVMAPMDKYGHRKDLILIDGICNTVAMAAGQTQHNATGNITTCIASGGYADDGGSATPAGISIDQAIAKEVAGTTKFPSIQLAIGSPWNRGNFLSANNGAGIAPITDPLKAFTRMFSDLQTDPVVYDRTAARKKSILDNVQSTYSRFITRVGRDDRAKLDNHMTALRELETRLGSVPPLPVVTCSKPATPGATDPGPDRFLSTGRVFMDLVAMAFACDLTRVATVDWNIIDVTAGPIYSWVPGAPLYHNVSHGEPDAPVWNECSTSVVDYMAGFFTRLKAMPDGAGTVWDNCLFHWTSEVGTGNHSNWRNTILTAGSAGGYLKTNQRIVYPYNQTGFNSVGPGAKSAGDLYATFLNAMGVPATTFGDPAYCVGPLRELVA